MSAISYVRIVAECTTEEYPMYLDAPLVLHDGVSCIDLKAVLFGFFGNLDGQLDPFVLRRDKSSGEERGRLPWLLDFGSNWGENDRYGGANLIEKSVDPGQQFAVRFYNGSDYVYVIKQVVKISG